MGFEHPYRATLVRSGQVTQSSMSLERLKQVVSSFERYINVHKNHMAMVSLTASSKRISLILADSALDGISWIYPHEADP